MGHTRWGLLALTGLVLAACWSVQTQVPLRAQGGHAGLPAHSDLIAIPRDDPAGGPQQITVIDARNQVMGVYRINPQSGEISLLSVRQLRWDLQMEQFNSARPLPDDIRALSQPR